MFKSTHITRAGYWELTEFTKKQCFSSLKRCSILNNMLITCESYWEPTEFIMMLRFRSLKCCFIEKQTHTSMSHWELIDSPRNLIPFVKIFLYPEDSTYYYCGPLGTNRINHVTPIQLTKF